jgi:hypothetical protein
MVRSRDALRCSPSPALARDAVSPHCAVVVVLGDALIGSIHDLGAVTLGLDAAVPAGPLSGAPLASVYGRSLRWPPADSSTLVTNIARDPGGESLQIPRGCRVSPSRCSRVDRSGV